MTVRLSLSIFLSVSLSRSAVHCRLVKRGVRARECLYRCSKTEGCLRRNRCDDGDESTEDTCNEETLKCTHKREGGGGGGEDGEVIHAVNAVRQEGKERKVRVCL